MIRYNYFNKKFFLLLISLLIVQKTVFGMNNKKNTPHRFSPPPTPLLDMYEDQLLEAVIAEFNGDNTASKIIYRLCKKRNGSPSFTEIVHSPIQHYIQQIHRPPVILKCLYLGGNCFKCLYPGCNLFCGGKMELIHHTWHVHSQQFYEQFFRV